MQKPPGARRQRLFPLRSRYALRPKEGKSYMRTICPSEQCIFGSVKLRSTTPRFGGEHPKRCKLHIFVSVCRELLAIHGTSAISSLPPSAPYVNSNDRCQLPLATASGKPCSSFASWEERPVLLYNPALRLALHEFRVLGKSSKFCSENLCPAPGRQMLYPKGFGSTKNLA